MLSGKHASIKVLNPLPEILNLIPWNNRVLDLEFADTVKYILEKYEGKNTYSNKYVLLLVAFLQDAGYVKLTEVSETDTNVPGRLILIKRI